jgi:MFS family permease
MIVHMLLLEKIGITRDLGVNVDDIFSWTLWTSAFGGWFFGRLADRIGRPPALVVTIAWLTVFAVLCAWAQSPTAFWWWHCLLGFGFGGVWAAGAVLTAEWASPAHRGKTVGLLQSGWAVGWGVGLAFSLLLGLFPDDVAWRGMFGLGLAPIVLVYFVCFVKDAPAFSPPIRTNSVLTLLRGEPAIIRDDLAALWTRTKSFFRKDVANVRASIFTDFDAMRKWLAPSTGDERLGRRWVITYGLSTGAMIGYYAIALKLGPLLAGVKEPTAWTDTFLIAGALPGYLVGGWVSDRLGRHPGFFFFALGTFVTVALCTAVVDTLQQPLGNFWAALALILLGFFASGVFSGAGAFLTELYPAHKRGEMQGSNYSFGRRSAYGGWLLHLHVASVGVVVLSAYVLVVIAALLLPETKGLVLTDTANAPADDTSF